MNNNTPPKMPQIPRPQGRQVNFTIAELNAMTNTKCPKCGGETFMQAHLLKRVSPLLAQSGHVEVLPIQTFICTECKRQLSPKDVEDESTESTDELPDIIA